MIMKGKAKMTPQTASLNSFLKMLSKDNKVRNADIIKFLSCLGYTDGEIKRKLLNICGQWAESTYKQYKAKGKPLERIIKPYEPVWEEFKNQWLTIKKVPEYMFLIKAKHNINNEDFVQFCNKCR